MEKTKYAEPPISTAFPGNAGSPRDAAMVMNGQNSKLLLALNKTSGGRKKKGGADIVVPIIKPLFYDPNGGNSQGVQSITLGGVSQINQSKMNNDLTGSKVSPAEPIPANQLGGCGCDKFGGRKRGKKRGGTHIMGPNQTWGCYSGGRTRKPRKTRKTRKTRKIRKPRKTRKTRKTK